MLCEMTNWAVGLPFIFEPGQAEEPISTQYSDRPDSICTGSTIEIDLAFEAYNYIRIFTVAYNIIDAGLI